MAVLLFALRKIIRPIEKTAAIERAKANSSMLLQKPRPIPVTPSTMPSPIPIFPPVALLKSTIANPKSNPNTLSKIDKLEEKSAHTDKMIVAINTIHNLIFFHLIS